LTPFVGSEPAAVSITLLEEDDERVSYEIESVSGIVHCRGDARFSRERVLPTLDLERLKSQMTRGSVDAAGVYAILASMGLEYGVAHRGITALHLGREELLADLRLPAAVAAGLAQYVLHPALVDAALQAAIGLAVESSDVPSEPFVPFALESLRVASPCEPEMVAWVRFAKTSGSKNGTYEFDIDLCGRLGNECVEIRGYAVRVLDAQGESSGGHRSLPRDTAARVAERGDGEFDDLFYGRLVAALAKGDVSVDEAVELG
jgi:hypothetical protein